MLMGSFFGGLATAPASAVLAVVGGWVVAVDVVSRHFGLLVAYCFSSCSRCSCCCVFVVQLRPLIGFKISQQFV